MSCDAKCRQEPLLYNIGPTRCVSQNVKSLLHNCRNKLHSKYTTNQMDLEGYSWPTSSKTSTTRRLSHRCRQQARSSTSFVDNGIDLWRKFFKVQSLGQSSRGKFPYLWRYPNFVMTQCRICEKKPPCQKTQLDTSSRFDTIPDCEDKETDRQTDTRRQHIAWQTQIGTDRHTTIVCMLFCSLCEE